MKRYISRGCEGAVIKALNEHSLACILGIPGVGKTTTARYIALKLREKGIIPVILTSTSELGGDGAGDVRGNSVDFYDENGTKEVLFQIPISSFYTINENLAKGLANAIVKVVNTVSKEVDEHVKRAKIVGIGNFIKGVGKKLGFSTLNIDVSIDTKLGKGVEAAKILVEVSSSIFLSVGIVSLAERLWNLRGESLKKEVVVIIDDLAELNFGASLPTLVRWLRESGARVLLVRRINLEEEFLEFSRDIEEFSVRYANKVLTGLRESKFMTSEYQIIPIFAPDFDAFEVIIRTNVKVEPEDMHEFYDASGGMLTLAILMLESGVKYEKGAEKVYYSVDEIKKGGGDAVEKAKSTLNTVINGVRRIYEEAKEKNFAFIAVFVQSTAYEELKKFLERAEIKERVEDYGYKLFPNLDNFNWIVDIRKEIFAGREREYYELNENWLHMRLFLDVLCDKEEGVRQEVEAVRKTLLDIMSEDLEKTEDFTERMLLFALDNTERLKDKADEKTRGQALNWGRLALNFFPELGFRFMATALEIAGNAKSDELLAFAYVYQLVDRCEVMNLSSKQVNTIVEKVEELMRKQSEEPAVLAFRAMTYSSIAKMLTRHDEEKRENYYIKSEQVLSSISNDKVRNLAEIVVRFHKAEYYPYASLSEALHLVKNAISRIEEIRGRRIDYTSDNFVCDFFKPLGGRVNEKLEEQLDEWYREAKFHIGDIFMRSDQLEDAEKAFKEVLKYSILDVHKLVSQSRIARIKVINDFEFEDFEKLYEQMKEHEIKLYPEIIVEIYAEYMLSCMFSGKELDEEEKREAEEHIKTDLMDYALLFGTAHKIFREFNQEEVLNALEILEMERAGSSMAALASVLRMLIENERGKALEVAEKVVFVHHPLLSRLFAELADGIQRGDEDKTNKVLIKLFYYHV